MRHQDDAFRSTIYLLHIAHMAWSRSAAVFEELAVRGLVTASAIERAYKADDGLMWRLIASFTGIEMLYNCHWGRIAHIVTYSEYFRPYFRRWRVSTGSNESTFVFSDSSVISRVLQVSRILSVTKPTFELILWSPNLTR